MLKTTLFAGALLAAGFFLTAAPASAQGWHSPVVSCASGAIGCNSGSYPTGSDGGLGRYCPPGYYPHSWPNGIRCEAPNGATQYLGTF